MVVAHDRAELEGELDASGFWTSSTKLRVGSLIDVRRNHLKYSDLPIL